MARPVTSITVVPLFMAQGGHLKKDLPRILDALGRAPRGGTELLPAIGDVTDYSTRFPGGWSTHGPLNVIGSTVTTMKVSLLIAVVRCAAVALRAAAAAGGHSFDQWPQADRRGRPYDDSRTRADAPAHPPGEPRHAVRLHRRPPRSCG